MRNRIMSKVLAIAVCGLLSIPAASAGTRRHTAAPRGCTVTNLPRGVLYKGENFHGGRGRSLILSCNVYHGIRGLSGTLPIIDRNGHALGAFRLFDPGHHPYGRRYYAYGSAGRNVPAYIKVGTACWAINNLGSRQGNVNINNGGGGC